jgi:AcrR family transcriptional regulator
MTGDAVLTTRQQQIVDAAAQIVEARGHEALTMAGVAARLKIRAPSVYKHFDGREDVLAHVVARTMRRQTEWLQDAEPTLNGYAAAYRRFALENPELYRLMNDRPLPRDRLPDGLERRAAAGLVAAVADPDLARGAWAFAHGMVGLELAGRFPAGADLDAAWAAGVDAFDQGARRRRSASPPASPR